jgi:hypothetical protein
MGVILTDQIILDRLWLRMQGRHPLDAGRYFDFEIST